MSLILPRRFKSQPPPAVEIADEYQDAEVLALFNGTEWRDLTGNHGLSSTAAPTPVIRDHGRSQRYGDILGSHIRTSGNIPTMPRFTAFAWVRPGVMGSGYKRILETNYSVHFYLGSSNGGAQYNFIVANSSLSACVGGAQIVGKSDFVAGVYNGTHCILYVNGREAARTTASAPAVPTFLCIGANSGNVNSGEQWVGDIDTVGIFPRAFSAGEMLALYERPDRLLKQPRRRLWSVPSVGGYTLTADTGSFTVTGTDANPEYGRLVFADSGAFVVTGQAATLARGYGLTADTGSLSITGTVATLHYGRVLPCVAGAVDVNGTDASLEYGRSLQAGSGAYSVTGQDANLIHATVGSYTITANPGTYSITGSNAELTATRYLSAQSGAVAITGTPVAFALTRYLSAETGSVAISSSAASLNRGRTLTAESGSFAFAGQTATLRYARAVIAEAGQLAITGMDATLTRTGGPDPISSTVERTATFRPAVEHSARFRPSKSVNVRFN